MAHLVWSSDLDTGIEVIDAQHREIVKYINQLDAARVTGHQATIGGVIEALVAYTVSHFGFEEKLMQDAGYQYLPLHKKVHELFIKRVTSLQQRFSQGEDVSQELHTMLSGWLFNHIRHEDGGYVSAVKPQMKALVEQADDGSAQRAGGWLSRTLTKFFPRG